MAYTDIDRPDLYFNTKLYTGNGSTQSINGIGFQPDWVWVKSRSDARQNVLVDAVRGANQELSSNLTSAEFTSGGTGSITAFNSDGFSLGGSGDVNNNGSTFVAWNWLGANGTASNTQGDITSTVSANTDSGFSIVSYTGNGSDNATIGHGLGSSIDFVIVKRRNTTSNWLVQGSKVGTGYGQYLELNSTGAISTASDNIKSVSSSTLTLGTNGSCNGSSDTYVAYCFAEKTGYSKFGSYVANGNTDGTFIYTGFKPAWVMFKRSSNNEGWYINDNKRDTYNVAGTTLQANSSGAEFTYMSSGGYLDLLSNGFKCRGLSSVHNAAGDTYIYMAFAAAPLVGTNNVPCTAR